MDETPDRDDTAQDQPPEEAAGAGGEVEREDGQGLGGMDEQEGAPFRVVDRRHAARADDDAEAEAADAPEDRPPTVVQELRDRAEAAEARLHEYIGAYKKEREEMEAFRRRLRETEAARARESVAGSLGRFLDVVDNLDRALDHAAEDDPLREGVQATREMLMGILQDEGVERIEPLGERFDPVVAEAIMTRPCDDDQEGQVIEVLRSGFGFGGKVLRAAQVVVGKKA